MKDHITLTRLIVAIVSNIAEEAAIVIIVLFGLPQIDIYIPLPGLIAMMVAWLLFSIFIFHAGTRALKKKPVHGLSDMIDSKGRVVNPLTPIGVVRIKGELWEARSAARRKINIGEDVVVVGQDGLKLVVRKSEKNKK